MRKQAQLFLNIPREAFGLLKFVVGISPKKENQSDFIVNEVVKACIRELDARPEAWIVLKQRDIGIFNFAEITKAVEAENESSK